MLLRDHYIWISIFNFENLNKSSLTDLSDDSILLLSTSCGGDCDCGAHGEDVFAIRGSSKKKRRWKMLKHTTTGSLNQIVMPIYGKAVCPSFDYLESICLRNVVTERWSVHDSTYVPNYTYFSIYFTSSKTSETTAKYQ